MRSLAAVLAVLGVAAIALTAWTGLAGASSKKTSLTGAGSTFVAPLVAQWTANYHTAEINYSAVGSGAGIQQITARTVDFGASDAPLTPDQATACNGCVQIPWAISATAVAYKGSGLPKHLHITGPVLAAIYLGKVTNWSDAQIKALNPKVSLPDNKITPIWRS